MSAKVETGGSTMKWRESTALSFGRFKGKPISELPLWYLKWLVEDCSSLAISRNQTIRAEIEAELERRVEAALPARIKAYERTEEDRIYLDSWLGQGGTWYRTDFPPALPSETNFWVPPYEMHFSSEWGAFQRRKADYRKRLLRRLLKEQIRGKSRLGAAAFELTY
jgi:hypothetical protein